MADTKTETPASELRAAAVRLRSAEHHGEITGDCDNEELLSLVAALLKAREPLASSLEAAAGLIDDHPDLARPHVDGEPCEDHACHIVHSALAVARALNGSEEAAHVA